MKKLFSLFLALLLLFLCGCTKEPIVNPTESNVATFGTTGSTPAVTIPTAALPETTVSDDTDIDYHQEIVSRMYQIPEYAADPLLECDPDRQVYISLVNQNCDYYPEYYFLGQMFWVITRDHYETSQISVQVPAKTKYDVQVADLTDRVLKTTPNGGDGLYCLLSYQHFTMQGADWKQLAEDTLYEQIARDLASNYKRDSKHYNGFIQAIEDRALGQWWVHEAEYKQLANEDLPKFSAYRVFINFMELGKYEETVETIDVTVGEETYTVDIGQWRLHTELPSEIHAAISSPGLDGDSATISYTQPPYADGYATLSNATVFRAEEDVTLLGYRQFETPVGEFQIVGAHVKFMEEINNEWVPVMDYYWDAQRPLSIEKGSRVFIDLYLKDERFTQYEFAYTLNLFMQYELRGKEYEMVTAHNLSCIHDNVWDTYLMAFEGIDTGEFYASYHIPLNWTWLREVPKEWLE